MTLNNISGGRNFSLSKFRQTLGSATKFGELKNLREPISKIVEKNSAAIKGGRFKARDAMRHLQSEAKLSSTKLNYVAKRDVERIFKRLEDSPEPIIEKYSRREALDRAMKTNDNGLKPVANDRPEKAPLQVRLNRADSEFNQEKVKDNRVSAAEDRLRAGTGVSGPTGPTNQPLPRPAGPPATTMTPPATHEKISLN